MSIFNFHSMDLPRRKNGRPDVGCVFELLSPSGDSTTKFTMVATYDSEEADALGHGGPVCSSTGSDYCFVCALWVAENLDTVLCDWVVKTRDKKPFAENRGGKFHIHIADLERLVERMLEIDGYTPIDGADDDEAAASSFAGVDLIIPAGSASGPAGSASGPSEPPSGP